MDRGTYCIAGILGGIRVYQNCEVKDGVHENARNIIDI